MGGISRGDLSSVGRHLQHRLALLAKLEERYSLWPLDVMAHQNGVLSVSAQTSKSQQQTSLRNIHFKEIKNALGKSDLRSNAPELRLISSGGFMTADPVGGDRQRVIYDSQAAPLSNRVIQGGQRRNPWRYGSTAARQGGRVCRARPAAA